MPDFAQMNPGDPFRIAAADWNAAMDAARDFQRLGRQGRGRTDPGPWPAVVVSVRNDTGGDLPAFSPVRLGASLTGISGTPRDDYESSARPCFAGLECTATGATAVLLEALPEGDIGRAVVFGVCVARVAAVAVGSYVRPPASGNLELVAGGSFARVLTAPVGSGDRAALVLVGGGAPASATGDVRTSAANTGRQWSAAKLVLTGDPLPPCISAGSGIVTGPATGEDVLVQPKYGSPFTAGATTFTAGHVLDSGVDYPIAHEYTADPTTGKRRFFVRPTGYAACVAGNWKLV